jgi:hypothetical protein
MMVTTDTTVFRDWDQELLYTNTNILAEPDAST